MRAQRAVSSMARVNTDHSTRPDTELQSDSSSTRQYLLFRGSPYSQVRRCIRPTPLSPLECTRREEHRSLHRRLGGHRVQRRGAAGQALSVRPGTQPEMNRRQRYRASARAGDISPPDIATCPAPSLIDKVVQRAPEMESVRRSGRWRSLRIRRTRRSLG